MPRVSRSGTIAAPVDRVWDLVSDPHNLPRWWPRAIRVEDVQGRGERSRWTTVLETDRGHWVRADFRCTGCTSKQRFVWSQDIAGTPFERILREAGLEIRLAPDGSEATKVALRSEEALRGLSRLGTPMVRGATRRRLDEALDGIKLALVGDGS